MNLPRATRTRAASLVGSVLAAALLLVGCSGTTDPAPSETQAGGESLLPAAEGGTQYPLTLETPWGDSTLPERPARVATVGAQALDTELVLALGAIPVTTISNGYKQAPWLESASDSRIEHVIDVERSGTYPYEAIAAAQPDLIVVFGYDLTGSYAGLTDIAPVLANSDFSGGGSWSGDWQAFITTIGEALDLQSAAAKVISDYDAELASVKSEHPEFGGTTASFSVYYGDQYGLDYQSVPNSRPAAILEGIGFSLTGDAADFAEDGAVSDELLSKIDADVVIIQDVSSVMDVSYSIEDLTSKATFQQVDAVKNDRVVLSPVENLAVAWAMSTGGPLGASYALDAFVPLIAEKLG